MIKQIMIPVAAFAVTATGVSAFNSSMLDQLDLDLSATEISAIEAVHELHTEGADRDEIHAILEAAGLDRDKMMEIRTASHEARDTVRAAVEESLATGDYAAFLDAVENTPRAGNVPTKANFDKFIKAHELREAGDYEAAQDIMTEIGIEQGNGNGNGKGDGAGDRQAMRDGTGAGEGVGDKQMRGGNGDRSGEGMSGEGQKGGGQRNNRN